MPVTLLIGSEGGWFGLATELWAGVIGALLGSIVGGLISWLLQRAAFSREAKRRDDESRAVSQATASTLLIKTIEVTENLSDLAEIVELARLRAEKDQLPSYISLFPLASVPSHVRYDAPEMALLLATKKSDLIAEVAPLARRYNSMVDTIRFYGTERAEVLAFAHAVLDQPSLHGAPNDGRPISDMVLQGKIAALEELATHILRDLPLDLSRAKAGLVALSRELEKSWQLGIPIELKERRGPADESKRRDQPESQNDD